ncbi:hypothetical protein EVAR_10197_1 [Eumeta japonica]|uniref:Uncharacterized protein n=1 Tax=Eumeta variegata TaxID=151549 RepID=A0A4C1TDI2_EUMVA|nr:hypothetical protein EVAR_10197_1 [Eumeta japonica]
MTGSRPLPRGAVVTLRGVNLTVHAGNAATTTSASCRLRVAAVHEPRAVCAAPHGVCHTCILRLHSFEERYTASERYKIMTDYFNYRTQRDAM